MPLRTRKTSWASGGKSGKLDSRDKGFGAWSDWPDLNDLCIQSGVQLKWTKHNTQIVPLSDELVTDPSVAVEATITTQQTNKLSRESCLMKVYWCGFRMQGKLACLQFPGHSVSHSIKNTAAGEDVFNFTIKAKLQVLPTKYNLSTWYPHTHNPFCLNHQDSQHLESIARIINGCHAQLLVR